MSHLFYVAVTVQCGRVFAVTDVAERGRYRIGLGKSDFVKSVSARCRSECLIAGFHDDVDTLHALAAFVADAAGHCGRLNLSGCLQYENKHADVNYKELSPMFHKLVIGCCFFTNLQ